MVTRKLTIRKVVHPDSAFTKKQRTRYEVSDGWSFPTKTMAQAHIRRFKKFKKD